MISLFIILILPIYKIGYRNMQNSKINQSPNDIEITDNHSSRYKIINSSGEKHALCMSHTNISRFWNYDYYKENPITAIYGFEQYI